MGATQSEEEESYAEPMFVDEEGTDEEEEEDGDVHMSDPVALTEDTFGMSVCSLSRDTYFLSKDGPSCNRFVRLIATLFLATVTLYIQITLLEKVKQFVSARAVHDIRVAYSNFEYVMYDCKTDPTRCYQTAHGRWRGNSKELFPSLADAQVKLLSMGEGDQDDVCRIPLSQPFFFGIVLLIWCLTCFLELRKSCELMFFILKLKTVSAMKLGIKEGEEGDQSKVIIGMTLIVKVLVFVLMFIPRICITCFLLWCGCRWLLATNNFGDLILNAVALEFVLLIKDIMYAALTPLRSKADLAVTSISMYPPRQSSHWFMLCNATLYLFFWIAMVYLYMTQWQQVLPDYKWDVSAVCKAYIKTRYAV